MPTPPAILNKIKLLLKLTQSPEENEASAAQRLADSLIEKHSVTPEELEGLKDPKPLYGDNEALFQTIGLVSWRQQLALIIAQQFDCQVVQEKLVPSEGPIQFHYFAYGADEDVKIVQQSYHDFVGKVEQLVVENCRGRGTIYIDSYCEGVVDAIKENIALDGIPRPKKQEPTKQEEVPGLTVVNQAISVPKPKPAETSADVREGSCVKDVMAYFKGIDHGYGLFNDSIHKLAADVPEVEQLPAPEDDHDASVQ
jgi:hypothetical protein